MAELDRLGLFISLTIGLVGWPLIVGLISWLLDKEVAAEIAESENAQVAAYYDYESALVRTYGSKRE